MRSIGSIHLLVFNTLYLHTVVATNHKIALSLSSSLLCSELPPPTFNQSPQQIINLLLLSSCVDLIILNKLVSCSKYLKCPFASELRCIFSIIWRDAVFSLVDRFSTIHCFFHTRSGFSYVIKKKSRYLIEKKRWDTETETEKKVDLVGLWSFLSMASKLLLIAVSILDVIAFGLAVGAEQRRSTVSIHSFHLRFYDWTLISVNFAPIPFQSFCSKFSKWLFSCGLFWLLRNVEKLMSLWLFTPKKKGTSFHFLPFTICGIQFFCIPNKA